MAGGDEPRRLCCSVSPADQCELATVLVPDGCLALRCAFVASESHGGTRSAPLTLEPRRFRNARTFRGRRVTRADRGMVLCVSAAGTSRRGPSNGMGGSEGGWAQKRRRDEKGGSLACTRTTGRGPVTSDVDYRTRSWLRLGAGHRVGIQNPPAGRPPSALPHEKVQPHQ